MPGRAGWTCWARSNGATLPVLMVTAYGDGDRRRRATGLGTAKVLTKPVDFDLLKLQLRQLSNAAD
jgi:DNA-binding response OmpR family regulator